MIMLMRHNLHAMVNPLIQGTHRRSKSCPAVGAVFAYRDQRSRADGIQDHPASNWLHCFKAGVTAMITSETTSGTNNTQTPGPVICYSFKAWFLFSPKIDIESKVNFAEKITILHFGLQIPSRLVIKNRIKPDLHLVKLWVKPFQFCIQAC